MNSSLLRLTFALGLFALGDISAVKAAGAYPRPDLCDRTCWQARPPSGTLSTMSGLNRAVIHHTASASDYQTTSIEQSAANVRAVQNLHMDVNGWSDIGYHFLSDKLGNGFEGRQGSLTTYVRGAHDGTNDNSFGFNMMGYFHEPYYQQPTVENRCILYRLIAWRMPDPYTAYGSGTYNGATTGFLCGHRDVSATACPGDEMYNPYIGTDYYAKEARQTVNALITTGTSSLCSAGPLSNPPAPTLRSVLNDGDGQSITLRWSDVGTVQMYRVFGRVGTGTFTKLAELPTGTTSWTHSSLSAEARYDYRVSAVGTQSESATSDVYTGVVGNAPSRLLIVDGNDRWTTQTENPTGANHDFSAQVAAGLPDLELDTADNAVVESGGIDLLLYDAVIWLLGEESTATETFSSTEQQRVAAYLNAGGSLFVSGAEVGWDLKAKGSSADQSFYATYLRADYVGDDAGAYSALTTAGGVLDGLGSLGFPAATMNVEYPDYLAPISGAATELLYPTSSGTPSSLIAGIRYDGAYRLVYFGFPVEAITDTSLRAAVLERVVSWLGITPVKTMQVSTFQASASGVGPRRRASASVTVESSAGVPVQGALVTGIFSGGFEARVTAETDASGVALLETTSKVRGTTGFTFCVDSVTHAELSYAPPAGFEPCVTQ